ncbi:MAG: hypothetical protein J6572_11070, partial [Gilliamella sp.]|nr:hypothetical protein [Gilliamella sp.]
QQQVFITMIPNLLSTLGLNIWYNMMMLISGALFLLSAMGLLPLLPATQTMLFASGIFLVSFGERCNHYPENLNIPVYDDFGNMFGRRCKLNPRINTVPGIIMDIVGGLILVYATIKLFI